MADGFGPSFGSSSHQDSGSEQVGSLDGCATLSVHINVTFKKTLIYLTGNNKSATALNVWYTKLTKPIQPRKHYEILFN